MGWFSKSEPGFFLSTVVPQSDSARIEQMLGVVNGEAIIGANIFRDLFSSVRDVVGGRAGGYERALSGARDAAIKDMIDAAREMGANGVVGIDFDYETIRSAGEAISGTLMSVFRAAIAAAMLSVIRVHAQRLRASSQRDGLIRYFAPVERLL
jgi:uncharacterized protein YbjQ (UPF0145 family)